MAHGLRGNNNECRESLSHQGGREEEEEGEEEFSLKRRGGRLAVQIIHFPDTDSGTNKLGSASRVVQ